MSRFTPEMTTQLAQPEGTIAFRYTLDDPISKPPPEPVALLETPPESPSLARLEVNPRLELSFLHAPQGENPRIAKLDLKPLVGVRQLQVYLVWSPEGVRLHVGDGEKRGELLAASSTE
jgi:hypothetical protein